MSNVFTGKYIRLSDEQYPRTWRDLRQEYPNVSFPKEMTPDIAEAFDHAMVYESPRPEVDAELIEGQPVLMDGVYVQTWDIREYTEQELADRLQSRKSIMVHDVNRLLERALEIGKPYEFPNGAIEHIQLRIKDQTILQTLMNDADRQTDPEVRVLQFRTAENNVHDLNALEMIELVDAGFEYIKMLTVKSWTLKDAITAAQSDEALPEVPVSLTLI